MRRRVKRGGDGHGTSHERWLVSYADFMTLLFAFFVVLYATSKADQIKQKQVSQAINSAFQALALFPNASPTPNHLKNTSANSTNVPIAPVNIIMGEEVLSPAQVHNHLQQLQQEMEHVLSSQVAQHTVAITLGRDGLVISLREAGFFNSGSAIPHPDALPVLRKVADVLGRTPYDLRVEGHTDNIPIHTETFDSNWELSSARSTRIARIFLGFGVIPPDRISAAGYAEYHPVSDNNTAEGRAENRRVDLVVRPRTQLNLALPGGQDNAAQTPPGWKRITE